MSKEDEKFLNSYYNADYINGLVKNFSIRSFIACMAPAEGKISMSKFWLMVWQAKVTGIVMLCPIKSINALGKCKMESMCYWLGLERVDQSVIVEGDGFRFMLTLIKKENLNPRIIHRRFKLELIGKSVSGPENATVDETSPCFEKKESDSPFSISKLDDEASPMELKKSKSVAQPVSSPNANFEKPDLVKEKKEESSGNDSPYQ